MFVAVGNGSRSRKALLVRPAIVRRLSSIAFCLVTSVVG